MIHLFQQLESFDYLLLNCVAFFPLCLIPNVEHLSTLMWNLDPAMTLLSEDIKECLVIFLRCGNHCSVICKLEPVSIGCK